MTLSTKPTEQLAAVAPGARSTRALDILRAVALLEGISFILLVFVAMPLKHVWHLPAAVRVLGSVHGLLFVAFVSALYRAANEHDWPLARSAKAFIASLLPFGTIVFDRSLKREVEALRR